MAKKIWGIKKVPVRAGGRPPFSTQSYSSKPMLHVGQERFSVLWTPTDVDPGECVSADLYTVPEGYQLNIGVGMVSCNLEIWQMCRMVCTPGLIGDYRYYVQGDLVLGTLSTTVLEAGQILTVYLFNQSETDDANFSVTVQGVLRKVQ